MTLSATEWRSIRREVCHSILGSRLPALLARGVAVVQGRTDDLHVHSTFARRLTDMWSCADDQCGILIDSFEASMSPGALAKRLLTLSPEEMGTVVAACHDVWWCSYGARGALAAASSARESMRTAVDAACSAQSNHGLGSCSSVIQDVRIATVDLVSRLRKLELAHWTSIE